LYSFSQREPPKLYTLQAQKTWIRLCE